MANPDAAVQDLINAAAISGLTKSTAMVAPFNGNLIRVPELQEAENVAGKAVFVVLDSGGELLPFMGVSTSHQIANVRVLIRSEAYDYDGGLTLAQAVHAACHDKAPSGYYQCRASPLAYEGRDERMHFAWSTIVELRRTV